MELGKCVFPKFPPWMQAKNQPPPRRTAPWVDRWAFLRWFESRRKERSSHALESHTFVGNDQKVGGRSCRFCDRPRETRRVDRFDFSSCVGIRSAHECVCVCVFARRPRLRFRPLPSVTYVLIHFDGNLFSEFLRSSENQELAGIVE